MKHAARILALALALWCLAWGAMGLGETRNDLPVVVSLGDSYSSGEGIEDFYDQELPMVQRQFSQDWLAHRSKLSWPGLLQVPGLGAPLNHYKGSQWFFAACSGAVVNNLYYDQHKEYNRDGVKFSDATGWIDPQWEILNTLRKQGVQVDYVTLTLGGNDADFAKVVQLAALEPATTVVRTAFLKKKLAEIWKQFEADDGIRDQLRRAYIQIAAMTDYKAHIIVAGYPKLFCEELSSVLWPSPFSLAERRLINENVHRFNGEIRKLVQQCHDELGLDIEFVSVEEEFEDHGAYSDPETQYINPVWMPAQAQDIDETALVSSYSMHPNAKGAQAYARCVQRAIDAHYAATHREATLQAHLEQVLIPEYGVMATDALYDVEARTNAELSGILSADIFDYDGDGAKEMLVSRFVVAPPAETHVDNHDEVVLTLEMYEVLNGEVDMADKRDLLLQGIAEIQGKYGTTAACFRFDADGQPRIALDTFCGIEEATATLTVYRYDGSKFVYIGGAGSQRYGGGDMLSRRALTEPDFLCAATCSEWWGLLVNKPRDWSTVEKWDTEAHDWELPAREDCLHFLDLYRAAAADLGVTVARDLRVLPLEMEDAAAEADWEASYNVRFTQALGDVYAGTPGLQPLWRVASFQLLGKPLALYREDALGSLDAWR